MKKKNMPIQRWRCCFSMPFSMGSSGWRDVFFNVRCCSPGAIHLQRPVGSLPKTRWFDCRTRRWLGCITAGEIGSEEPPRKSGIRWGIFESLEFKEAIICKKSFVFGGAFWVRIQLHCFCFQALCVSQPQNLGDGCMLVFIGVPIWNRSPLDKKNRWFQKLVLPSLKHTMSMIPSLNKTIGKVDTIQWCIFDDPMVLPSLKQFSFADLEGVPAYSQGGVWLKLTKGGSSSNRKVPRKNETKVDTL